MHTVVLFWALLLAAHAIPTLAAGLRAVASLPTSSAHAVSGIRVTRAVVLAVALVETLLAVHTSGTLGLATYSCLFIIQSTCSERTFIYQDER